MNISSFGLHQPPGSKKGARRTSKRKEASPSKDIGQFAYLQPKASPIDKRRAHRRGQSQLANCGGAGPPIHLLNADLMSDLNSSKEQGGPLLKIKSSTQSKASRKKSQKATLARHSSLVEESLPNVLAESAGRNSTDGQSSYDSRKAIITQNLLKRPQTQQKQAKRDLIGLSSKPKGPNYSSQVSQSDFFKQARLVKPVSTAKQADLDRQKKWLKLANCTMEEIDLSSGLNKASFLKASLKNQEKILLQCLERNHKSVLGEDLRTTPQEPTRPKTQMKPRNSGNQSGVESIYRPTKGTWSKPSKNAYNNSLDHQFKYLNHVVHLEGDHGTKRVQIEQPASNPMPLQRGQSKCQKSFPKKSVTIKPVLQQNSELDSNLVLAKVRQQNIFQLDGVEPESSSAYIDFPKAFKSSPRKKLSKKSSAKGLSKTFGGRGKSLQQDRTFVPFQPLVEYIPGDSDLQVLEAEKVKMKFDQTMNELSKVSQLSIYSNDYQNWSQVQKKLVLKRPEEKCYPLHFHRRVSSVYEGESSSVPKDLLNHLKLQKDESGRPAKVAQLKRLPQQQQQQQQIETSEKKREDKLSGLEKFNKFFIKTTKIKADSSIKEAIKRHQFLAMKDVYRGKPTHSNKEFSIKTANFHGERVVKQAEAPKKPVQQHTANQKSSLSTINVQGTSLASQVASRNCLQGTTKGSEAVQGSSPQQAGSGCRPLIERNSNLKERVSSRKQHAERQVREVPSISFP